MSNTNRYDKYRLRNIERDIATEKRKLVYHVRAKGMSHVKTIISKIS